MMTENSFNEYLARLKLPEAGVAYLQKARGQRGNPAPPARNVQSKCGNVTGRYCSVKVGLTQDFESYRCEHLLLVQSERDPDIVEYYTQPHAIPLSFSIQNGRRTYRKPDHVPDVLALHRERIYFIEAKPKAKLEKYKDNGSSRFACDSNGGWTSPAGEKTAAEFGFGYEVWCPEDVPLLLARNIRYLDAVAKRPIEDIYDGDCMELVNLVASNPGITLQELEERLTVVQRLALQWLIGRCVIYCDLEKALLVDTHRVRLFVDARTAILYQAAVKDIEQDGPDKDLSSTPSLSVVSQKIMNSAEEDRRRGLERLKWLQNGFADCPLSSSQQRRIKRAARLSKEANGTAVAGVISSASERGNTKSKLRRGDEVEPIARELIRTKFAVSPAPLRIRVWEALQAELQKRGLPVPRPKWFYKFLKKVRTPKMDETREGTKAVYFSTFVGTGIAGVSDTCGEHPFHRVHIDHTQLDLLVVDEESEMILGKPWLSLTIDAFTGDILAWYLSFNHPSVDSLIVLFRRLVLRHKNFPFEVVTDNGAEFYSLWYQLLLARKNATLIRRPPSKPRFGAIIERAFGKITSVLLYSLLGNTQRLKVPRLLAAKDHPKKDAIWTLPMLDDALEKFCQLQSGKTIPQLGRTPAACVSDYLQNSPRALLNKTEYTEDFYISTLLEVDGGTRRVQRGFGIKFGNIYYSHISLDGLSGQNVRVLHDPDDLTGVYVSIDGQWVRAVSKYQDRLKGYSRRELAYYTKKWRQRYLLSQNENYDKANQTATFLEDLGGEEQAELKRKQELAARNAVPKEVLSRSSQEALSEAQAKLRVATKNKKNANANDHAIDDFYDVLKDRADTEIKVTRKKSFKL